MQCFNMTYSRSLSLKPIFHLVVGNGNLTKGPLFWVVYSIALGLGIVFLLRELGQCFSLKKIKKCRSYFHFDNIFELFIILMTICFLILILVVEDRDSKKFVGGLALLFGKLFKVINPKYSKPRRCFRMEGALK